MSFVSRHTDFEIFGYLDNNLVNCFSENIVSNLSVMLNDKNEVIFDLVSHLKDPEGEFNDVEIEASDGEVVAPNKTILSLRSPYFRDMFSSKNKFAESSTGQVKLPFPKVVIEKIVLYLYSGELDCDDLPLKSLLDVLELFQLINLPGKYSEVEALPRTKRTLPKGNILYPIV